MFEENNYKERDFNIHMHKAFLLDKTLLDKDAKTPIEAHSVGVFCRRKVSGIIIRQIISSYHISPYI